MKRAARETKLALNAKYYTTCEYEGTSQQYYTHICTRICAEVKTYVPFLPFLFTFPCGVVVHSLQQSSTYYNLQLILFSSYREKVFNAHILTHTHAKVNYNM